MQFWFDIGCIIAGIMVGGFSYFLTRWILVKQLAKIALACRDITSGKINTSVSLESPDSIGDIANGFNIMVHTLQELIQRLSGGVKNMTGVTVAISSMSDILAKTIEQEAMDVSNVTAATHKSAETVSHISDNLTKA
ncbi:MAG: methyl-accepting chemotaxis protein [Nitrospiraceae bacterium]|nr:MAG: methyl-accepting chemotaxis protein [Nitrospiraceae bacterium]